jgi:hypothetical protein
MKLEKNKVKDARVLLAWLLFGLTLFILNTSFTTAANGCCFETTSGFCTFNSDQASCTAKNGSFFSSISCSISQCNKGCCSLGTTTQFTTSRTCEILSGSYGFSYPSNFANVDAQTCYSQGTTNQTGACLYPNGNTNDCKFVSSENCPSGIFHPGILCSDSSLNTNCYPLNDTICDNEAVYYLDSCGNLDVKKQQCDYASGTKCDGSNANYSCKSLNCNTKDGEKKNGEEWCVQQDGSGNVLEESFFEGEAAQTIPGMQVFTPVGSRYYRQYCLEGNIYTEPCADFRNEICKADSGKAQCIINPWQECLAGAVSGGGSSTASAGSSDGDCNSDFCTMTSYGGNCIATGGGNTFCGFDGTFFQTSADGTQRLQEVTEGDVVRAIDSEGGYHFFASGCSSVEAGDDGFGLDMCVPQVPGGLEFYPPKRVSSSTFSGSINSGPTPSSSLSGQETAAQVCNLANFEGGAKLYKTKEISFKWTDWKRIAKIMASFMSCSVMTAGNTAAGAVCAVAMNTEYDKERGCIESASSTGSTTTLSGCKYVDQCAWKSKSEAAAAPGLIKALDTNCEALGDCAGKINWVETPGSSGTVITEELKQSSGSKFGSLWSYVNPWKWSCSFSGCHAKATLYYDYKIKYECLPWSAPEGGECEKCGADGLPCSEYRCKSLGSNCEYYEPDAAKGYCKSSDDASEPTITCTAPAGCPNNIADVKPFTPIDIKIETDEESVCKFDLNKASSKYSTMAYDFGTGGYGLSHTLRLNLPGQTIALNYSDDENLTAYPILAGEGNYTLYVRCLDVAGNGEISSAYPIKFSVMKAPDTTPPFLSNFNPVSNSQVEFNKTTKLINFEINEPAECKWSNKSKDYNLMENEFLCDSDISSNALGIYSCSGTLNNVTLNLGDNSAFYIRCKDQPWIENSSVIIEGVNYSRNTHDASNEYVYFLSPSQKLEIDEISPAGFNKIQGINATIDVKAITSGGAFNGIATCYWRISNITNYSGVFSKFLNTDSNYHAQPITNPYLILGNNNIEVSCNDSAGNVEIKRTTFDLVIDNQLPKVRRIYHSNNDLKIDTDEEATCYYSLDQNLKCAYNPQNGTLMSGLTFVHSTAWMPDKNYYIKCNDYFGNYDNYNCAIIVRTY